MMDKQNHTITTLAPVSGGHKYLSAVISTASPDPHIMYTTNNQCNGSIIPPNISLMIMTSVNRRPVCQLLRKIYRLRKAITPLETSLVSQTI